jgi:hypothetical protein
MLASRALLTFFALPGACALAGCSRASLPDPKAAASAYAKAAKEGDSAVLYAMLTRSSQRTYGPAGARALVSDTRRELLERARSLSDPAVRLVSRAQVRFADGELAELEVEEGRFRIASAGALPAGARTPVQALDELRQALARRSYPSLLRVLSRDKSTSLEEDVRSLVTGLEEPEALDIKVNGDSAEVSVPGGHVVKLKREAGVWRIEDFD